MGRAYLFRVSARCGSGSRGAAPWSGGAAAKTANRQPSSASNQSNVRVTAFFQNV
jgi:hypothetical protein